MTVATLITVAALPALWFMQRDSSAPGSGVAAAGPGGGIVISGSADQATSTTMASTTTATGPAVTIVTPSAAVTAAGASGASTIPVDRRISGTATYKRYSGYGVANPCMAPRVPINTEITVHSQNTGRSITCVNVVSYTELPDPQIVVVINTETFLQMADTRDAPVFVELTW
jgi:hypothetical protein